MLIFQIVYTRYVSIERFKKLLELRSSPDFLLRLPRNLILKLLVISFIFCLTHMILDDIDNNLNGMEINLESRDLIGLCFKWYFFP
jgi:hypothetical protein